MRLAKLKGLAISFVALSGALSWMCFTLLATPVAIGDIPAAAPWQPVVDSPPVTDTLRNMSEADTAALLERLVFSPTRRPPQPRPPEPAVEPQQAEEVVAAPAQSVDMAPPENVVLKGVLIEDARREALLTSPADPDGGWFALGSEIQGWKISRIEAGSIALAIDGREIALMLYADSLSK